MSNIVLNGVTYSGSPAGGSPWKPESIEEKITKIGTVIVSENGTRTMIQRAIKREWQIKWTAPEATRASLAALAIFSSSFIYIDEHGVSYTVQMEEGDHQSSTAFVDGSNIQYYTIQITIREA